MFGDDVAVPSHPPPPSLTHFSRGLPLPRVRFSYPITLICVDFMPQQSRLIVPVSTTVTYSPPVTDKTYTMACKVEEVPVDQALLGRSKEHGIILHNSIAWAFRAVIHGDWVPRVLTTPGLICTYFPVLESTGKNLCFASSIGLGFGKLCIQYWGLLLIPHVLLD